MHATGTGTPLWGEYPPEKGLVAFGDIQHDGLGIASV